MPDFEFIFNRLLKYHKVYTIRELSEKIDVPETTISKWKQRSSIGALRKKCYQLEIYDEIFEDTKKLPKNKKEIDISFFNKDIQRLLNISIETISDNQELEDSFKNNLKLWIASNV